MSQNILFQENMTGTWIWVNYGRKKFGGSPWSKDIKGVHFVGLNTVGQAPDFWSAKRNDSQEREWGISNL